MFIRNAYRRYKRFDKLAHLKHCTWDTAINFTDSFPNTNIPKLSLETKSYVFGGALPFLYSGYAYPQ